MPAKESLAKDDWLRTAMEMLRTRGIGGVCVLPLAKKLRVSRGSFYWHFENLQDLRVLRRVLRKRLEYVTSLFREAGFSPREARARGELMAVYIMMSEEADFSDKSEGERLRLLRHQVRSLMS